MAPVCSLHFKTISVLTLARWCLEPWNHLISCPVSLFKYTSNKYQFSVIMVRCDQIHLFFKMFFCGSVGVHKSLLPLNVSFIIMGLVQENLILLHAENEGTCQPAHMHSLISSLVVHFLKV